MTRRAPLMHRSRDTVDASRAPSRATCLVLSPRRHSRARDAPPAPPLARLARTHPLWTDSPGNLLPVLFVLTRRRSTRRVGGLASMRVRALALDCPRGPPGSDLPSPFGLSWMYAACVLRYVRSFGPPFVSLTAHQTDRLAARSAPTRYRLRISIRYVPLFTRRSGPDPGRNESSLSFVETSMCF